MPESNQLIKVHRRARMKGVELQIDGESWEHMLKHSKIPEDTPIEQLRVRRYPTKSGTIILRISKVPEEELN